MTILQLKYVITIASSVSIREAASKLYVSQPALSASVHDLEEELGFRIFGRNNKGITLTAEGMEFLKYAKQAVSQFDIIEESFIREKRDKRHFSVSMQHYVFAVNAFISTVQKASLLKYTFAIQETRTEDVLQSVRDLKSEVGIIAYPESNMKVFMKLFKEYQLEFYPLMKRDNYIYVWNNHPLANEKEVSLSDLAEYPLVAFEQNTESAFYLPEEAHGEYNFDHLITSNDRATSTEIMAGLNGYSIGTGDLVESLSLKEGVVCIRLKEQDQITIGYIRRKNYKLSDIGKIYIEELEK
ncbi:MAG: LysR family transcriptional regulator, partial [Firmicutes bacterium]|nr:LysR family transcriptional regulator [Bacillota bacterium]